MATPDDLATTGGPLVRFQPYRRPRAGDDSRKLFLVRAMHDHLQQGMDNLLGERLLTTPKAATHRCFSTFCLNEPFVRATASHNGWRALDKGEGVVELKTFDVRAFGFFWRPKCFIVTNIELKRDLTKFSDYDPYIHCAHCWMTVLDLDVPPCIVKDAYHDLF